MTTTELPIEPTSILTLEGTGYSLAVSPEIETRKADLVAVAAGIVQVTNGDESALAQVQIRNLASFRNLVEKARVEVKKPVLEIGRKIDVAAAEFVEKITAEESRLKRMVGTHAEKVAVEKRAAEAEERRKFEEARRAKEEAERAAREAEEAKRKAAEAVNIQEAIAAKAQAREAEAAAARAEEERQQAQRDRMAQSAVVATTTVASGVKFEPDFEVIDIDMFARNCPALVTIEPKRRDVISHLKKLHAEGLTEAQLAERFAAVGLRVSLKPVVSTR